jgi:hypothetical protein
MLRAKRNPTPRVTTVISLCLLAPAITHAQTDTDNRRAAPQVAAVSDSQSIWIGRGTMRIRMNVEGKALAATLEDNATTREFAALLPLTLTLTDYNATEKISDLPKRLSTKGAPPGSDPAVGDISYYAPWGNLAVFYRDFGYSEGLVKLGTIESGIEALRRSGPLRVTIELSEK